jgi:hypothetical protein
MPIKKPNVLESVIILRPIVNHHIRKKGLRAESVIPAANELLKCERILPFWILGLLVRTAPIIWVALKYNMQIPPSKPMVAK